MNIPDLIYKTIESKGVMTYLAELLSISVILFSLVKQIFNDKYAKETIFIVALLVACMYFWLYKENIYPLVHVTTLISMYAAFISQYVFIDMYISLKNKKRIFFKISIAIIVVLMIFIESIIISIFNYSFFPHSNGYSNTNLFIDIVFLVIMIASLIKYYFHRKNTFYI